MVKGYPKRRVNEVKNFAHKESMNYNGLFRSAYAPKGEPFPSIVIRRVQIRLHLFKINMKPSIFKVMQADIAAMFEMLHVLIKKQPRSNDTHWTFDYQRSKPETQNISYTQDADGNRRNAMFLFSILDFMRDCMVESEEKTPIDLCEFARITDRVFDLAIYNKIP